MKRKHPMKAAVIGLGFVGLPLSLLLQQKGFDVTGIDIDSAKINKLNQGKSSLSEINSETVASALSSGRYTATSDTSTIKDQDIIIVCVPTPLNEKNEPNLNYLQAVGESLAPNLRKKQLVVLESSVYPGTTQDFFKPILEQSGLSVGKDFYLAYSPERIDPGNKHFQVHEIPKLVSGVTPKCLSELFKVYSHIYDKVIKVSSTKTAEITKLLENSYRFINISFINEFALLCEQLNINVWEVIEAASTKPYGFQAFYPGPGIGGHCIPIDPLYLKYKAKQIKAPHEFIDLSQTVNKNVPLNITNHIADILSNEHSMTEADVFVYGVTYKKDVDDARESPAEKIIQALIEKGARVQYHDPYIEQFKVNKSKTLSSVPITKEKLKEADCVLILTDHSNIPIDTILNYAKVVYDTRNVTKGYDGKAKIYRLGGGHSA
ncbi:UDP-N-acetyl-D-glucosamine dehydrogenase [Alteribacillus persepolensis]|uniref:UDP-N-acetyl-D-glucosamine dehydrogenase n=1 Tax=Alteribacillus persepolensis TaxID=568899 RepID=A0A1G8IQK5_9BACI|nr:UDP-N-acetyl-D-glucosamine dehydrogenase [Alteribacillus persepolensis]